MTIYFESHINLEPPPDERRAELAAIAARHDFRLAKLLMQKGAAVNDAFITGRGDYYDDIYSRMIAARHALNAAGFVVRRMKIEDVIFDQRFDTDGTPVAGEAV